MTRKEQIEKAAQEHIDSDAVSPMHMQMAFGDFINGAMWADRTMIEKAIKWMEENLSVCKGLEAPYILARFRKAMEE